MNFYLLCRKQVACIWKNVKENNLTLEFDTSIFQVCYIYLSSTWNIDMNFTWNISILEIQFELGLFAHVLADITCDLFNPCLCLTCVLLGMPESQKKEHVNSCFTQCHCGVTICSPDWAELYVFFWYKKKIVDMYVCCWKCLVTWGKGKKRT